MTAQAANPTRPCKSKPVAKCNDDDEDITGKTMYYMKSEGHEQKKYKVNVLLFAYTMRQQKFYTVTGDEIFLQTVGRNNLSLM